jgi:hypothetical protein
MSKRQTLAQRAYTALEGTDYTLAEFISKQNELRSELEAAKVFNNSLAASCNGKGTFRTPLNLTGCSFVERKILQNSVGEFAASLYVNMTPEMRIGAKLVYEFVREEIRKAKTI